MNDSEYGRIWKMLNTVVISMMLYALSIWAEALKAESSAQKLASLYRLSALRICCVYRTISEEAVQLIARRRREQISPGIRKLEREESMRIWQRRWE